MLDAAAASTSKFDIIPWDSAFELGIEIIDKQHRQLVTLLNELAHEYVYGGEPSEVERVLDTLIDYAAYHFATEEALWAEISADDPWFKKHLQGHSGFVSKIRAMQSKLATATDDKNILLDELLFFLTSWLTHHILYEDKRFSLMLLHTREGMDTHTAKQRVQNTMMGETSVLIQRVLSMYKELSSRTLALEREAYSRQVAEQTVLEQEHYWSSLLGASSDNLWDWDLTDTDGKHDEQLLQADQFAQDEFRVHPDDWPALRQEFLVHMLGRSKVFRHQHRVIDGAGNERWIQSRGKIIEQDASGRAKRMVGTQTDVTERKTAELTLQRERDTRMLISEFAADFMASSAEGFDAAINRALQRSGEYIKADRSYVFLVSADGHSVDNSHEWCARGIQSEIDTLQGVPFDKQSWWWQQFREVGYILVPRVSEMPREARSEQQILRSRSIESICVYPLYIGKELAGFIGNDSIHQERQWGKDVIELMSLMSDLMGIALGHRQLHHKREQVISQLERAEQQAQLGHWHIDFLTGEVIWSKEMFRIFECEKQSFTPNLESYLELVHPDDRASLYSSYQQAKASLSDLHLEHRVLLCGGRIKHIEVRGRFSATAEGCPAMVAGTTQDVTEKVQQRESLQRLAFQDSLTGLPNRRSIEETLQHEMVYCEQHDRRLVLALLDLDNFRETNDQYGAALGDALLKALAQRMQRLFNDNAVIARVGGDEFVVLFTRLKLEDSYYQQLNRLLATISQPLTVDGIEVVLTSSIGATDYPQPMEVSEEQLLRQAQQALFQAKMLGKSRFQRYDIGSEWEARALTDHLAQIAQALHAGELVLYYQPKVNMKTGVVFGVEALLRWQKSSGELVPPGEFLPALHNQPLEIELGDWVIHTALTQLRLWKQQGLDIQVSVNVSSQQLFDNTFVEKLSAELQHFVDVSPAALQLEVLESSMLKDLEAISAVMHRCRQLGVGFALDDFGTGYSSLAYLKHLPAGVLKVDRSFVREMLENTDDLSIITGVIGMANAFGMRVIAEGVENAEQGNMLLRLGCELGQGYGIARPMPATEIPEWIQDWQALPSWLGQKPVERHNLPLLYAEVENRNWVMELKSWLRGERQTAPVMDRQSCKIGAWLASDAQQHFKHQAQLPQLLNLHRALHSLGDQAIAMHARGETEAALLLLTQIQQQRDLFLAQLRDLIS